MDEGIVLAECLEDFRVAAEAAPLLAHTVLLRALSHHESRPTVRTPVIVLSIDAMYHEADRPFYATARVCWDAENTPVDLSTCFAGAAAGPCLYRVSGIVEHRRSATASPQEASLGRGSGHYVCHVWRHGSWFTANDRQVEQQLHGPFVSPLPYIIFLEEVPEQQVVAEHHLPAVRPCPKANGPDRGEQLLVDKLFHTVREIRVQQQAAHRSRLWGRRQPPKHSSRQCGSRAPRDPAKAPGGDSVLTGINSEVATPALHDRSFGNAVVVPAVTKRRRTGKQSETHPGGNSSTAPTVREDIDGSCRTAEEDSRVARKVRLRCKTSQGLQQTQLSFEAAPGASLTRKRRLYGKQGAPQFHVPDVSCAVRDNKPAGFRNPRDQRNRAGRQQARRGRQQARRGRQQDRKSRQQDQKGRQRDQKDRQQDQTREGRAQVEMRKKRAWGQRHAGTNADNSRYDACAEADSHVARFQKARSNYRVQAEEHLREP